MQTPESNGTEPADGPSKCDHPEAPLLLDATVLESNQLCEALRPGQAPKLPGMFGEFRLLSILGKGGMGVVYEAIQESLDRKVAVKVMSVKHGLEETQKRRFVNESMAVARMEHPNIIPVYSVGEQDGISYFSMRLVEGSDLRRVIKQLREDVQSDPKPSVGFRWLRRSAVTKRIANDRTSGDIKNDSTKSSSIDNSLSVEKFIAASDGRSKSGNREYFRSVAQLGCAAASALHHAHSLGVLHRDIKPGNLMLDQSGHLWVMDFGLAQVDGGEEITQTGDVLGTYRYMSPEQASGRRNFVDLRTDVYSLGVTLYELLTLHQAVSGESQRDVLKQLCFKDPVSLAKLNPTIPHDLQLVIHKAIERDPADRYQSAELLEADLNRFIDGKPIAARKPTLSRRGVRWIQSHKQLATAIAGIGFVLLLSSLAIAGVVYQGMLDEREQRQQTEAALERSEGLRLLSNGALQLDANPGLALSLMVEGAQRVPSRESKLALQQAMDQIHEMKTVSMKEDFVTAAIGPNGRFAAYLPIGISDPKRRNLVVFTELQSNGSIIALDVKYPVRSIAFHDTEALLIANVLTNESERVFSPVVCGSDDWEDARVFPEHDLPIADGRIVSPDGSSIVLCHRDGFVEIKNLETLATEVTIGNDAIHIKRAIFSVSGQEVITVAEEGQLSLWSVGSGNLIHQFSHSTSLRVQRLRQTQDSRWIVLAGSRGAEYFRADSPEAVPTRLPEQYFAEAPNHSVIFVADRFGKTVRVIDARSLQSRGTIELNNRIDSVLTGHDRLFVTVRTERGGIVEIYRADTLEHEGTLKGHLGLIKHGRFCEASEQMVTIGADRTVRMWSPESGRSQRTMGDYRNVSSLPHGFSSDGKLIAVTEPLTYATTKLDRTGRQTGRSIEGTFSEDDLTDSKIVVCRSGRKATITFPTESRAPFSITLPGQVIEAKRLPDHPIVILRSAPEDVWRWNFETGGITKLSKQEGCIFADVSSKGDFFGVGYRNGQLDVWEPGQNMHFASFPQTDGLVACAVGDEAVATLNGAGRLTIRSLPKGEIRQSCKLPITGTMELQFLKGGKYLLVHGLGEAAVARLFDAISSEAIQTLPSMSVRFVREHSSLPLLAVVTTDRTVHLWDLETKELKRVSDKETPLACFNEDSLIVHRSPDADNDSHRLAFLDLNDLSEQQVLPLGSAPSALTGLIETGEILIATQTGSVAIFDFDSCEQVSKLVGHHGGIRFTGFRKEFDEVVTVSADQSIRRFRPDGTLVQATDTNVGQITTAAMSPDGILVAVGTDEGSLSLWDASTLTKVKELPGHTSRLRLLSFSNNHRLISGSLNESVRVWDLRKNEPIIVKSSRDFIGADLSEKANLLLTVEGRLKQTATMKSVATESAAIFNLQTGERTELFAHNVHAARFSPQHDRIGVLMRNGQLHVLDAATFEETARIAIESNRIGAFAFCPTSNDILTWQEDGLSVWSTNPVRETYHASAKKTPYETSWLGSGGHWEAWHPNGRNFVTFDRGLLKWSLDPLSNAKARIPRALTESERRRFEIRDFSVGDRPTVD